MKKIILFMAFLFTMNAAAFAENEATTNVEAYNISANINSLVKYLDLSKDQVESFENVQKAFEDSLRGASVMGNDGRKKMVKNSIDFDLKNMKFILNDEQFKKYVKILNVTLTNRGIEW